MGGVRGGGVCLAVGRPPAGRGRGGGLPPPPLELLQHGAAGQRLGLRPPGHALPPVPDDGLSHDVCLCHIRHRRVKCKDCMMTTYICVVSAPGPVRRPGQWQHCAGAAHSSRQFPPVFLIESLLPTTTHNTDRRHANIAGDLEWVSSPAPTRFDTHQ